jgi:hypothetical protein
MTVQLIVQKTAWATASMTVVYSGEIEVQISIVQVSSPTGI